MRGGPAASALKFLLGLADSGIRMPGRREIPTRWLVAICAFLALAASGSAALASGGPSGKSTVDPQKVGSATATCPHGTGVIAAGFASPHFSPANNRSSVARIASRRVGKRRLKTSGFNFGNEAGEINSIAYCSKAGRDLRVVSEKAFVAPKSAEVAVATCPSGSRVISGGFASPGFSPDASPRVLALTSKRVGQNRWRVEGFNIGNDDNNSSQDPRPGTLVAYAYCLNDSPRIVTRQKRAAGGVKGKVRSFKARCPHGSKALSGGFDGNLYLSANPTGAGAVASRRADHGRSWRISAISISGKSAKATVYAYCVPRHG